MPNVDPSACAFDRGRNHVAAVRDRRRAKHEHEFGARIELRANGLRQLLCIVTDAFLGDNRSACGREPLARDLKRFLDHFLGQTGKPRRDHADFPHAIGCYPHETACCLRGGECGCVRSTTDRKGNDLRRCDHLAFRDRTEGRKRRKGNSLVDQVQVADRFSVDHENASCFREQVGASGEGFVGAHVCSLGGIRKRLCRLVFADVARFEFGNNNVCDPGRAQRCDLGVSYGRAFSEYELVLADRMHGNTTARLLQRERTELHFPYSSPSRNRAVISARIETAISAGDTAPMSRPIGA